MKKTLRMTLLAVGAALMLPAMAAAEPGVSDTEIRIGDVNILTGPASFIGQAVSVGSKVAAAEINAAGGINGRKINFITYDDGFSPPKTVEMVRKLVEDDKVFAIFQLLGTPTNTVVQKYLNQKKVPQLFVATGASKWGMPKEFPWTMGWQPDYHTEGAIYAKHILANVKDAKIGVLMQNDDYGKDYYEGFKDGLGKETGRVVQHVTFEVTDPTVDSQVIQLKDSGANVFFNIATPKAAAQAIRKAADIGWKPAQYLNNVSASVGSVMKPAGFDNSQGIITAQYLMDPTDKQWADNADFKGWVAWMDKWMPGANKADGSYVFAYAVSYLMEQTLKKCGDNLTRENLMRQAANHQKLRVPLLLPGITINTSPTDFYPVQSVQLASFKGETWNLFGDIMSAEST